MDASQMVIPLLGIWGLVTLVLVVLLIYRVTLASREDDQIFIDDAEQHHYKEQQELLGKLNRLRGPIIALTALSVALLLTTAGVWIYQGLKSF
jgi:hypothetical protein